MGLPQPNTPVHCNNATALGIANNTIKRQCWRSMEMRFFWVGDKIAQEMYDLTWHPGQETLPITKATTLGHATQQCTYGTYT